MSDSSGQASRIAQQIAMWDDGEDTEHSDLSVCPLCDAPIDPDPPDGFSQYARQVAGYLDHFADVHPDHEILNAPEGYL